MEAVSAVKMRKNQTLVMAARPFALEALRLLRNLESSGSLVFKKPKTGRVVFLVIAADRGLCGAFNANVFREEERLRASLGLQNKDIEVIAVGQKAIEHCGLIGQNVAAEFSKLGDVPEFSQIRPILQYILAGINSEKYREIYGIYTHFWSTFRQEPRSMRIYPLDVERLEDLISSMADSRANKKDGSGDDAVSQKTSAPYEFEPSQKEILDNLVPFLIQVQIYHMIIESDAGEHSARLLAMRNARDNAGRLLQELTLQFNKLRQGQITREVSEIVGGKEALEAAG